MNSKHTVIFGAGAAGKGLVGLLFSRAGYSVTFVDSNQDLVQRLQTARRYDVLEHRLEGGRNACAVEHFDTLHAADRENVAEAIVRADIVLTAVFAQNLPDVAVSLAGGIARCRQAGRTNPLNVIACENMKGSSSTLKDYVMEHLDEDERAYALALAGFPDCMINRVVPNPKDALKLETEDYAEWTAEAGALKGPPPEQVDFIEWVDNQAARLDRKLVVYNGGHAAAAYFGYAKGLRWIDEAVNHPETEPLVGGALDELAGAVQRHHQLDSAAMDAYKNDYWLRCRNPGLKDEITRIARQPIRKLGRNERFIMPALWAIEYGLPHDYLVKAIGAALTYRHADDEQSNDLAARIASQGPIRTLAEITGLDVGHELVTKVARGI